MTPIGHLSVSFITGKSIHKFSLPALMIGGVLPDIDFVFILFEWFNQVHRVITHNIFFIVFASLVGIIFVSHERRQTVGFSMFIGGAVHLFIDSCMDNNPTNGVGIALLWPLSAEFFSPFNLLSFMDSPHGWNEPSEMLKSIVPNMMYEIPFYFMAAFHLLRRRVSNRTAF
jgi:membrane-bound metal-dependent hydrolase YbcI (DUF457 family)